MRIKKNSVSFEVKAPVVVSTASIHNTFRKMLPLAIVDKSYYGKLVDEMEPGLASMSVFVGLNASAEELGVTNTNTWAFDKPGDALGISGYTDLSVEDALNTPVPMLFISFPSTKDPNWKLHPGRYDTYIPF